jgi:tetratricopeptide (TPR) repeat protein
MALGLVDRFEDLVTPSQPAVAINALVKSKAGHLMETERQEHTGRVLDTLLTLWGGADGQRPGSANIELTRLALLSASAPVLAACAADALSALDQQFAYQQAATWAQQTIAVLDAAGVESPFGLLRRAGEACLRVGDVEHIRTFYQRALEQVATRQAHGETIDLFEQSALTLAQARLQMQSGEPEAALPLFEQAQRLARQRGAERDATVVMGDIARLRARQGEVEEALRLHQERLAVNRRLSDLDGQASAMWDIAQIELGRDNVREAVPLIVEAYQICDQINRLEGSCAIGMALEQLLIANDRRDQGIEVLHRSEEGFRRMQRHSEADRIAALITRLGQG